MRGIGIVAAMAAAAFGVNLADQRSYSAERPEGPPPGDRVNHRMGKRMSAQHYEKHDPAYGIKTKGRRGAAGRARALAARFGESRVGKRQARAAAERGQVIIGRNARFSIDGRSLSA